MPRTTGPWESKPGEWNGPFKSSLGVHFVKVLEYTPSREMPMSQVRSALVSRWTSDRKNAVVKDKVTELASDYLFIDQTLAMFWQIGLAVSQ